MHPHPEQSTWNWINYYIDWHGWALFAMIVISLILCIVLSGTHDSAENWEAHDEDDL